jgi:putative glutamine amidotransferase
MPSDQNLVAITQRVVEIPGYREFRDCLDQQWAVWLQVLGLVAVPVPNRLASPAALLRRLSPQAIILSGGNNLASDVYDGPGREGPIPDAYKERDDTETALVEYAVQHQIPLLGCCRGMQFLQVFFGGRLLSLTDASVRHVGAPHEIALAESTFRAMAGQDALVVNSFHNYGISASALAQPLQPLAVSLADRTVEAFVHRTLPIVGIMWHPERPNPAAKVDLKLATSLFASRWPRI